MKGELANETVNYDTKTKDMYQFDPEVYQFDFRSSRSQIFFKIGILKISHIPLENTCVGDTF